MQAIEFETDVLSNVIKIPQNYQKQLKNKHIKILAVYSHDISNNEKMKKWNKLKKTLGTFDIRDFDPVEWQRKERAEWDGRI
ncbi:MAG: hypothetical protein U9O87_00485 [Verrucomicrobiota bacterium]|nr:hypothetical protein [Verrucomicrobiota bacterium]